MTSSEWWSHFQDVLSHKQYSGSKSAREDKFGMNLKDETIDRMLSIDLNNHNSTDQWNEWFDDLKKLSVAEARRNFQQITWSSTLSSASAELAKICLQSTVAGLRGAIEYKANPSTAHVVLVYQPLTNDGRKALVTNVQALSGNKSMTQCQSDLKSVRDVPLPPRGVAVDCEFDPADGLILNVTVALSSSASETTTVASSLGTISGHIPARPAVNADRLLLDSAAAGDLGGVADAIKLGADINTKTSDGQTALMLAAGTSSGEEVLAFLLSHPGKKDTLNEATQDGRTAIGIAAGACLARNVQLLLQHKPDLGIRVKPTADSDTVELKFTPRCMAEYRAIQFNQLQPPDPISATTCEAVANLMPEPKLDHSNKDKRVECR